MTVEKITTEAQLNDAFKIRKAVFVEEQHVPLDDEFDEFDEFDKLDANCRHVLINHGGRPVGTGRIRWIDGVGKLERICILKDVRSLGFGKLIIEGLETIAKEEKSEKVKLHAQTHAEGFYHKLGYKTASDVFMEDGIPHIVMTKTFK